MSNDNDGIMPTEQRIKAIDELRRYGDAELDPHELEIEVLRAENHVLKLELEKFMPLTMQRIRELAEVINEELPASATDQAADEWGKSVIVIAINRLRKLEELRLEVIQQPQSWYTISVRRFFAELEERYG